MKFGYSGARGMSATDIANNPNPLASFHPHPFKGLSPVAMRQPCLLVALPFDTTLLAMLPHRSQRSGAASHLAPLTFSGMNMYYKVFLRPFKKGRSACGADEVDGAWAGGRLATFIGNTGA